MNQSCSKVVTASRERAQLLHVCALDAKRPRGQIARFLPSHTLFSLSLVLALHVSSRHSVKRQRDKGKGESGFDCP